MKEPTKAKKRPSSGLTRHQVRSLVKRARKGEDIGKPGKHFSEVATKAARRYGSKEAGKRVAAASMYKNAARK